MDKLASPRGEASGQRPGPQVVFGPGLFLCARCPGTMLRDMDEQPQPFDDDGVWRPPHGPKTRWIARLILLLMALGLIGMLVVGLKAIP